MSVAADYAEQEYLVVTESEPEASRGSCNETRIFGGHSTMQRTCRKMCNTRWLDSGIIIFSSWLLLLGFS
jgi:hypothetical protein